ncbi:conserved hypothetical protein [Sphingomonas aurantiaca]|uniref:Uncharacterized protein n=1 Tax=Sphingomonas aurantiaca TaxID=185949 RepID=A0A5E7YKW4_9SPHN|nr:hypothetical protein [Sphingomonas aurantiaca]VVT07379.1 conserved hypothetical protein [Sphingomonas aurantiaca]
MTAITAFAQPSAAYLLTDGALYHPDGVVASICSKTLIAEAIRLAIAPSGRCTSVDIAGELERAGAASQAAVMVAIPAALWRIRAANVADATPDPDMQVHVALWSERADEPQIWMIATNRPECWGPYRPGTWLRVDAIVGGDASADDILGRSVRLDDPASFDPVADCAALIDYQRAAPWPDGRHYIGGMAELVTVSRSSVSQTILRRWPDKVGALIAPSSLPQ